jgi:ribosome-associated heat shock protein Hsp15
LRIRNDSGEFVVQVLRLDALRGPAPQARAMYLESEASIAARAAAAAERRSLPRFDAGAGKPSKRDRRELERFLSIED